MAKKKIPSSSYSANDADINSPTSKLANNDKADKEKIINPEKKPQLYSFTSTNAFFAFWNEVSGIIQNTLKSEENQKLIQKSLTEKIVEIQQQGMKIPDGRLKSADWESEPMYAQIRSLYSYNANLLEKFAESLPLPDIESKRKVNFLVRQLIDFYSPANFSLFNPEFINQAIATKGESITKGLNNLANDLQKGRITHVNEDNFKIGENLAVTEGQVIYQCPLFELIEYKPQSAKVRSRPMLFVPPCINKYYIMDLSPNNSLVRYTVEQGQHLYLISWRNIDEQTIDTSWENYVESVISAVELVRKDSKSADINILGFCVGGTILSCALAVMAAKKIKLPASLTLLTSLLDFAEPGDLGVFLNSALIVEMENRLKTGGAIVPGSSLAQVFAFLRPKDLIWNYVSSKYLKGETPRDFDILYWNSDSTNQPLKMMAWYLRNCYLENNLLHKKVKLCGEVVDFSKINIPAYIYASREDHIVPWGSAYNSAKLLSGDVRFVLGASGHIAGVINPPAMNKRNYWIFENSNPKKQTSTQWFEKTTEVAGSWWADWIKWLNKNSGNEIPTKSINYDKKKVISPAPGEYVKQRAKSDSSQLSFLMILEKMGFNKNKD